MNIKQLLIQPIGQKIGGFPLSIKTYKKNWQVGEVWWCQVICMDETGEMPVDVKIGARYNPLRGRCTKIDVIVAQVQEAEYLAKDRKKLVVDQFSLPTTIGEPPQSDNYYGDSPQVIRGKCKCWLVAAKVETGVSEKEMLDFAQSDTLKAVIDSIIDA